MNDLEQDIRTALADDNGGQFYDLDREEGLRDMIAESFRGKKRWMAILVWTESLVFTALAVVVAVKFFSVDTVKDSILYATLFVVLSLMIALKLALGYELAGEYLPLTGTEGTAVLITVALSIATLLHAMGPGPRGPPKSLPRGG